MDTILVFHELYMWHDSGKESHHPYVQPKGSNESPESKRRFYNLVQVAPNICDAIKIVKPRMATKGEILWVHSEDYYNKVEEISKKPEGGMIGHELHIAHEGLRICLLSSGGIIDAVDKVYKKEAKNCYALVRPPGHHAETSEGMGFCCFNNIAIAAEYAIRKLGMKRVAVVDWDVHHGNGTEKTFYNRNDVLFISLHQDRLYPLNTGDIDRIGEGEGLGYNINIPLPPGSGEGAYLSAFDEIVIPALQAYKPELILVSSGFDGSFLDPLGRMMLTSDSFRHMTKKLKDVAQEVCEGRLVLAHEGGYSELYVPYCGLAVLEELSGVSSGIQDPFIMDVGSDKWQRVQPYQSSIIAEAKKILDIAILKK